MEKSSNICPFWEKYSWYRMNRYNFFSKFDEWIQIDEVGLYSVRAEKFALETWNTMKWDVIYDAFCCVWWSAIWFALAGKKVITVELDKNRLEMAKNNAKIYGVYDKITFIHWNTLDIIKEVEFDWVFFDPPWWWTSYSDKQFFNFSDFSPNWNMLFNLAKEKTNNIAFGLPNNFDLKELNKYWDNYFLQENKINQARWFYTVYYS